MSENTQIDEVAAVIDSLSLPTAGHAYVTRALENGPTRSVSDGASNVTGFLPIPHLQYSVPFESRSFERVCLAQLAFRDDVVAIIAQPQPIKLTWKNSDGRRITVWHTPDYLVIYTDHIDLIEAKPGRKLVEASKKSADRFKKSPQGEWISPAGLRATQDLGICYEVFCPGSSDNTFQRNIDFVWDYLWHALKPQQESAIQEVVSVVSDEKHILLCDLLDRIDDADAVYLAIARKAVSFAWRTDLLRSPETATVYTDNLHRDALAKAPIHELTPDVLPASLHTGASLRWIDMDWSILSVRDQDMTLVNSEHRLATLTTNEASKLLSNGAMSVVPDQSTRLDSEAQAILKAASPAALEAACDRYSKLQRYLVGDLEVIPARTARDWKRKVGDAERRFGVPIIGLIARHKDKGRSDSGVDQLAKRLALTCIHELYATEAARSGIATYRLYVGKCETQSVSPVSYATFMKYIKSRDQDRQNRRRHGQRFAYQNQGPNSQGMESLPTNGDRVWETVHIDHTPADIETASAITGENLGQPWLTIMTDAWSRMILAIVLSFHSPSSRTLMLIMRECVRRWGRLPNKIVVDRGPDFRSTYFDKLLSGFNVGKLLRGTGRPRDGSVGERIFGTANTNIIHQLVGNTKNRVLRRGLSSTHDPAKFAVWTPDDLSELLDDWAFNVYPSSKHAGLGEPPIERYERSIRESGARELVRIPYSNAFLFATLPEPSGKTTRKVHRGTITIDHIQYRGLARSINPFNGQSGAVRIEPDDPSKAWIFLDKEWRELICTNDLVREYVERAVKQSRLELEARLSRAGLKTKDVDAGLIELLERAGEKESQLADQKAALTAAPILPPEPEADAEEIVLPPIQINATQSFNVGDTP